MKKVRVIVRLKEGVLDPQGKTVQHGLQSMGFHEVAEVRIGKVIELDIQPGEGTEDLAGRVSAMCQKLLANPVIENFEILGA